MNAKRFAKLSISLTLVMLILVAAVQIAIDPLFQYHQPLFGLKPVVTDERYQIAGMAKNFEFDNCVLGNSLCENFNASSFDKQFSGKTIKLSISGSVAYDWTYVLSLLNNRNEKPKNVFSNIDPFTLNYPVDKLNADIPEYLYDTNYINDCSYLFNFEILKKYTIPTIKQKDIPDLDTAFLKYPSGEKSIMRNYSRPKKHECKSDISAEMNRVEKNLDSIESYVVAMPNTEFHFFFTPFSILYWDKVIREGDEEWWYKTYITTCERFLRYKNVSLYLWEDNEMFNMMVDLNNYIDTAHYGPEMCDQLTKRMGEKQGLLNKNDYEVLINKFFVYLRSYDYDAIFT